MKYPVYVVMTFRCLTFLNCPTSYLICIYNTYSINYIPPSVTDPPTNYSQKYVHITRIKMRRCYIHWRKITPNQINAGSPNLKVVQGYVQGHMYAPGFSVHLGVKPVRFPKVTRLADFVCIFEMQCIRV